MQQLLPICMGAFLRALSVVAVHLEERGDNTLNYSAKDDIVVLAPIMDLANHSFAPNTTRSLMLHQMQFLITAKSNLARGRRSSLTTRRRLQPLFQMTAADRVWFCDGG